MNYKAIMLDVDGTLIPYEYGSLPSEKVISAINKAKNKVHVCLVTGRAFNATSHILEVLGLTTGYIVNNAGGVVLDIKTKKPLYSKPIDFSDAKIIADLLFKNNIPFFVKQNMLDGVWDKGFFKKTEKLLEAYMIFTADDLDPILVDKFFDLIKHLSNITFHKVVHRQRDKCGINITHAQATKLHGIEVVLKKLNLKREEIIGVGDGYNDFPLLMASGLKVAMGNANDDLKEIADYVAPSVTDDGVAHIIEKFIL